VVYLPAAVAAPAASPCSRRQTPRSLMRPIGYLIGLAVVPCAQHPSALERGVARGKPIDITFDLDLDVVGVRTTASYDNPRAEHCRVPPNR
jgi:hypothetical protein